jgi:AraC-like DNA-binding protein
MGLGLIPRLFLWGARALYLGPAFGLSPHRNAAAVLCIGVDGSFRFASDPHDPAAAYVECRSLFVPANTLHHLRVEGVLMGFLYVDPLGDDCRSIAGQAPSAREKRLIPLLRALARGAVSSEKARDELDSILGLGARTQADPRIVDALHRIRQAPADPHDLASLAAAAGLSKSRFLHVFKQSTGVPLRRYKIWARMGSAVRAMTSGLSLTRAALDSGFSSSAHFSAAFRRMFGLAPSQLAKRRIDLVDRPVRATGPPSRLTPVPPGYPSPAPPEPALARPVHP